MQPSCPVCGRREDPSSRFCAECGALLESPTGSDSEGRTLEGHEDAAAAHTSASTRIEPEAPVEVAEPQQPAAGRQAVEPTREGLGAVATEDVQPTCTACGHREDPSAQFCSECGASLAAPLLTPSAEAHEPDESSDSRPAPAAATTAVLEPTAATQEAQDHLGRERPTDVMPTRSAGAPSVAAIAGEPAMTATPASRGSRRRWALLVGVIAILAAAGVAAAVVASGSNGGKDEPTTLADAAFWNAANTAFGHLTAADRQAQVDLGRISPADGADRLYRDGNTIAAYADTAAARLHALSRLSAEQIADRRVLLVFVAANRRYATRIEQYAQEALDVSEVQSAAAAASAAGTAAVGSLPASAQLPPPGVFDVSAPTVSEQTPTTETQTTQTQATETQTTATTSQTVATTSSYVAEVDALLGAAHRTLGQVKAFVPNVAGGSIGSSAAIAEAERLTAARELTLATALRLQPPAAFARAHLLLVESLRLSVADDKALVLWVRARASGSDAQTQLDRVNQIGTEATAAKQRFVALYGSLRQAATGKPASSLPDGY